MAPLIGLRRFGVCACLSKPGSGYAEWVRFIASRGGLLEQREKDIQRKGVTVKFTSTAVKTAIGAAGIAAVSVFAAGAASAAPPPNIQGFGTSEQLVDGPMVTSYTVSNLQPSTAIIPGFTPKGTLYQADIVAKSDG